MAVLVDFSQVLLSSCYVFSEQIDKRQLAQQSEENGYKNAENIIRHVVLSQLLTLKKKYQKTYGDIVICCDAPFGDYWRKNAFKYYKANRKKAREESSIDFHLVFTIADQLIDEIKESFPYKVVRLPKAEADDVVASIIMNSPSTEKFLIVSEDQDFVQLQRYSNVTQIKPRTKKVLKEENPTAYLKEKVIRGDKGDGIPNVLTEENAFVDGKKQTAMRKERVAELMANYDRLLETSDSGQDFVARRLATNRRLIDFDCIPSTLQSKVMQAYQEEPKGNRGTIFNYLVAHRCNILLKRIQEF